MSITHTADQMRERAQQLMNANPAFDFEGGTS